MIWDEKEGFYFDKIRINFRYEKEIIEKILPIADLRKESRYFNIRNAYWKAKCNGYITCLEATALTQNFLNLLLKNSPFPGFYANSYVEIAHDKFYRNVKGAIKAAEEAFKTIRKKYSFGFVYEGNKEKNEKEIKKDLKRGLIHIRTFYSSCPETRGQWFKHVLYPRLSKINGRPCVHEEWRITNSFNVRNKTGIEFIKDLVDFDFKAFFEDNEKRFLVHEKLKYFALGRCIKGLDGRRKFNPYQKMTTIIAARRFCDAHGIETFSDLKVIVSKEDDIISKSRGPRTEQMKTVSRLNKNLYRFKRSLNKV